MVKLSRSCDEKIGLKMRIDNNCKHWITETYYKNSLSSLSLSCNKTKKWFDCNRNNGCCCCCHCCSNRCNRCTNFYYRIFASSKSFFVVQYCKQCRKYTFSLKYRTIDSMLSQKSTDKQKQTHTKSIDSVSVFFCSCLWSDTAPPSKPPPNQMKNQK